MLALKPSRGKPAVRNFRGGDGVVGIIRNPVRAIAPLDHGAPKQNGWSVGILEYWGFKCFVHYSMTQALQFPYVERGD